MRKMFLKFFIIVIILMVFVSCSLFQITKTGNYDNISVKKMVASFDESLRIPSLKNRETGVLTFVNLNNLKKAEPLGRFLQEKISYNLFERGYRLKELRLGKNNIFLPKTGEINLTRLMKELINSGYGDLKSIIVGTYIDAGKYYYINAKLIELKNGLIRANGEMKIQKGKYIGKLIKSSENSNGYKSIVFERQPLINNKTE